MDYKGDIGIKENEGTAQSMVHTELKKRER